MNKWLLGIIGIIAFAFTLSTVITLSYADPVAYDIHTHVWYARAYANGEFPFLTGIHRPMPYPPLYHLFLVPSVWLGIETAFTRLLQIVFFPLAVISAMWLMNKHHSKEAAFYTGLLLISANGFYDRVFPATPQAIDAILFPLIIHFIITNHKKSYVASMLALVYSHGFAAMSLIGGAFLHRLPKWKLASTIIIICSLPIFIVSMMYLEATFKSWGTFTTSHMGQEQTFWQNPIIYSYWYMGPVVAGLPVAFKAVTNWRKLDEITKISLLTIPTLCFMFIVWQDRFLTYVTMPLAFILATATANWKIKHKPVFIFWLYIPCMVFAILPFLWLYCNIIYATPL